ncbi:MAG: adenylate/guanylate cyclase domain-containing protein [Anaerolineae bacterium]|nr:adenylate/guanylate cyclase domain-containing protein [Anaerolineae bacterium]
METRLPTPGVLNERLYGSRWGSALREFVTNSGLFWIFDALWVLSADGIDRYVSEVAHWFLLAASLVQTVVISRAPGKRLWWGNFTVPVLYTLLDVMFEGGEFFDQSYHAVLWAYAAGMALAYALYTYWPGLSAILQGVLRTSLLPALYMISEEPVWSSGAMSLSTYWFEDSAHLFILLSSVFFGVLLGISTLLRDQFERMLRDLSAYLERLTSWVFDPALVADSYGDTSRMGLQRVQRTILFMDIRGFTAWSERTDPAVVVQMLNAYYTLAEQVVEQHGGFKMQLIGDEILTRFATAEDGVRAARALQAPVARLLAADNLGAGIGLHTGDVIEGLIGSQKTRQYGVIGDSVNTAARLQSAARSGEVVLSAATRQLLPPDLVQSITREDVISAKGKTDPLPVYIIECPAED